MICPDFSLSGVSYLDTQRMYSLSNIASTARILLYFYPKDNTPGCSNQAIDFTRLKDDYKNLGITIVGVSPDSITSHKSFIEKKTLEILLLSDPEKTLITALGAWGEKKNYGKTYFGLIRSTFLIEVKSGEIIEEWRNIRAKGHAERILKILSA